MSPVWEAEEQGRVSLSRINLEHYAAGSCPPSSPQETWPSTRFHQGWGCHTHRMGSPRLKQLLRGAKRAAQRAACLGRSCSSLKCRRPAGDWEAPGLH